MKDFLHIVTVILIGNFFLANYTQAKVKQPINGSLTPGQAAIITPWNILWTLPSGSGSAPDTYELQNSPTQDFTDIKIDISGITVTSNETDLSSLSGVTLYYWRVIRYALSNQTATSISTNFTTNSGLPVELTSFVASLQNNNVNLKWTTATEVNNYGFKLERRK